MESTSSVAAGYARDAPQPFLQDRLIALLPGPRWVWIAVWAALPALHYVALMQVLRIVGHPRYVGLSWTLLATAFPSHLVQAYMIVICLWSARRLADNVRALKPTVAAVCAAHGGDAPSAFPGLDGPAGPLVLTALVTIAQSADTAMKWGVVPAAMFFPYQALWVLPIMTLFWVYIAFLVGLDRLGRKRMTLGSFPEDLSLGLGPIGATVFHAFLILCAIAVPFLIVSLRDRLDLSIGLAFFGAGVGAFFLSTWRLHGQMVETKRTHVTRAGMLYAETYEPLGAQMTPQKLQACAPQLSAAEALVRRASAIQEWPFDERTMTRIVAISTGVVTAVIARSILSAVGL